MKSVGLIWLFRLFKNVFFTKFTEVNHYLSVQTFMNCKDQTFLKEEGASSYQQNCVKLVIHPDEQLNCLSELAPPSTNQLLTGKVERLQKSAPGTSHQRYYLIIATFCSYTKLYYRQLSYLHLDFKNLRSQQFST